MDRKIENGTIKSTFLGVEDHGIMTLFITVEGEWGGQGFGGYGLDRAGAFGVSLIRRTLEAVGVDKWEALVGKNVRVDHDYGKIHRLGHIVRNQWVDIEATAEEFK